MLELENLMFCREKTLFVFKTLKNDIAMVEKIFSLKFNANTSGKYFFDKTHGINIQRGLNSKLIYQAVSSLDINFSNSCVFTPCHVLIHKRFCKKFPKRSYGYLKSPLNKFSNGIYVFIQIFSKLSQSSKGLNLTLNFEFLKCLPGQALF